MADNASMTFEERGKQGRWKHDPVETRGQLDNDTHTHAVLMFNLLENHSFPESQEINSKTTTRQRERERHVTVTDTSSDTLGSR